MKAMGLAFVFIVFISVSLFQGLNVFSNFWLTYWTEDPLLKNTSLSGTKEYEEKYIYYLVMYLILGVIQGNIFCPMMFKVLTLEFFFSSARITFLSLLSLKHERSFESGSKHKLTGHAPMTSTKQDKF